MRPVGGHYSWQTPTQLQQLAGNTPDGVADDQVQVGGASTRERHCLIEVPGGSSSADWGSSGLRAADEQ